MAQSYPNRSDLRNPMGKVAKKVVPGQTYGEAGKQMAAQKAMPISAPPTSVAPAPVNQQPQIAPGQLGDLTGMTQRPDEPISSGAPYGAGPGPEVFGAPMMPDVNKLPSDYANGSRQDLIDQVRFAYSKYPNTALFQLILELEDQPLA